MDLVVGNRATSLSKNCLFGIMGHKGQLLRATVSYEEALYLTKGSNRYIVECHAREAQRFRASICKRIEIVGSNPTSRTSCEGSLIFKAPYGLRKDGGANPSPHTISVYSSTGGASTVMSLKVSGSSPGRRSKSLGSSLEERQC